MRSGLTRLTGAQPCWCAGGSLASTSVPVSVWKPDRVCGNLQMGRVERLFRAAALSAVTTCMVNTTQPLSLLWAQSECSINIGGLPADIRQELKTQQRRRRGAARTVTVTKLLVAASLPGAQPHCAGMQDEEETAAIRWHKGL